MSPYRNILNISSSEVFCFPKYTKKRAENGTRTRDPDLGKVVLYQLSYFRNKNNE